MSSFTSSHSASKKRAVHTQDDIEAPRVKIPRSAFTSFVSASLPSSPPLLPLSSSLPEMHSHVGHHDRGLRLPFSLSNLAPENRFKKRSRVFDDAGVGDIEIVANVNKPSNKPLSLNLTRSTPPPELEETVAPVQTEFEGPINLMDARTGRIATTRDPRGGFGYDQDINFTPESSFNSFSSVKTVVKRPISYSGLGPINLVDVHSNKIVTTRDPRGGFGYDPDVNFTPNSSFELVQTAAPTSRNVLDSSKRPIYAVSLFGPPQNNLTKQEDDDDSRTVVGSPQDVFDTDEIPSLSQSSFSVSEIIEPNSSFDDVLVCRANGDSSFTSPSTKPCSAAANIKDIYEAEYFAGKLLKLRPDSAGICDTMMSRLERMVNAKIATAKQVAKASRKKVVAPKPVDAAIQLRKYLLEQKETRLEMGEVKGTVNLEIGWADWLVKVTQSGVVHLKLPGCTCRPELMAAEAEQEDWS
ncbi:uncharacterized protein N0V89_005817 [Didymosphaeria variabile]|uniref:Uncharacterized protein n=1 Tax=Didymosphaeria variabile TaxID=1932322 RepID=A0A9W9CBU7_9PLEO|nr:uncharacterized protein N0V89_005817 [Didymosphaeria variabile]KAJ4354084.1 hypothetical protein N0V89_005817 [Didymosphaeria variabile]